MLLNLILKKVFEFISSKRKKIKRGRTKEINVSMCVINHQEDLLNDLENPLITDLNSSEWFEDESQFSFQNKIIYTKRLRKDYRNFTALDDVTFSVYEGEIFW